MLRKRRIRRSSKKLEAAAKGYAAAPSTSADAKKELQKMGAPQQIIDELDAVKNIEILPINWPIVVWFCQVDDLMHYTSTGHCLGLDLTQVKAESEMSSRKYTKKHFDGLRIMSRSAARTINKA